MLIRLNYTGGYSLFFGAVYSVSVAYAVKCILGELETSGSSEALA
ncbi:hypothetical protein [Priestia megaterium]|nr:hypothetical protein [Priestia megaterium]